MDFGILGPPPRLNSHRYQKLLKSIQEYGGVFACRGAEWDVLKCPHFDDAFALPALPMHSGADDHVVMVNETKIRESFLNLFVSVFTDYREFLIRGQVKFYF